MNNRVIIMVGVPGSGKSTVASEIAAEARDVGVTTLICSTDDFFMVNGRYQFDPRRLAEYHARNFQKFALALADGTQLVILDNTNIREEHREPYVRLAKAMGYTVRVEVVGEFTPEACEQYARRNTHGVPLESIKRMAASVQLPKEG